MEMARAQSGREPICVMSSLTRSLHVQMTASMPGVRQRSLQRREVLARERVVIREAMKGGKAVT